jgi:hypothetical protein
MDKAEAVGAAGSMCVEEEMKISGGASTIRDSPLPFPARHRITPGSPGTGLSALLRLIL